jgi:hypothetical protein
VKSWFERWIVSEELGMSEELAMSEKLALSQELQVRGG